MGWAAKFPFPMAVPSAGPTAESSDDHVNPLTVLARTNKAQTFREALQSAAYPQNKSVILAMVDAGYMDMAMNFYETSIVPSGLSNMLFVSLHNKTCQEMHRYNLPCFTYSNDSVGGRDINNTSKDFLAKMNIRTSFTYYALSWGYTILQVDIDLVFFNNPYPYFTCADCAIESMQDGVKNYINAGFMLIRANKDTVQVYKEMVARALQNPMSEDQDNINEIVQKNHVKYRVLSSMQFVCGLDYYENPKRYFADTAEPCPECVVVRNNGIVSKQAKVYRFKEMLQWMVDINSYYSSSSERYLMYNDSNTKSDDAMQRTALINALAISQILNRTLLLPKFHCTARAECALNSRYYIKYFDQYFPRYRESMFLSHPKVPQSVITNQSPVLKIGHVSECRQSESCYEPSGASEQEIVKWFGTTKTKSYSVLRFADMYNTFSGFSNPTVQEKFYNDVKAGLKDAKYRQF